MLVGDIMGLQEETYCSRCGYSKSGYTSDKVKVCVDCGARWPSSDKKSFADMSMDGLYGLGDESDNE